MRTTILAFLILALSFQSMAQTATQAAAAATPKKYIQINYRKSGGAWAIRVPSDQTFTLGGLAAPALESRFSSLQSLPPFLEFMEQNGYKMTQAIPRRGWGLFFMPGTQYMLLFERK